MFWHDFNHYHNRTVLGNAVFDFTATWRPKLRVIVKIPLAVCLIHDNNYCSNDVFRRWRMFHVVCSSKAYTNSKHTVRKTWAWMVAGKRRNISAYISYAYLLHLFCITEVFRVIELSIKKKYTRNRQSLSTLCETVITLSRAVYWIKDVQWNCHHRVEKGFKYENEV
jgi:hypothetical protein